MLIHHMVHRHESKEKQHPNGGIDPEGKAQTFEKVSRGKSHNNSLTCHELFRLAMSILSAFGTWRDTQGLHITADAITSRDSSMRSIDMEPGEYCYVYVLKQINLIKTRVPCKLSQSSTILSSSNAHGHLFHVQEVLSSIHSTLTSKKFHRYSSL